MDELTPIPVSPADIHTAVILARMETKLDRVIEDNAGHEPRIRALETRPVLTPKSLVTAITVAAALASIVPAIAVLAH